MRAQQQPRRRSRLSVGAAAVTAAAAAGALGFPAAGAFGVAPPLTAGVSEAVSTAPGAREWAGERERRHGGCCLDGGGGGGGEKRLLRQPRSSGRNPGPGARDWKRRVGTGVCFCLTDGADRGGRPPSPRRTRPSERSTAIPSSTRQPQTRMDSVYGSGDGGGGGGSSSGRGDGSGDTTRSGRVGAEAEGWRTRDHGLTAASRQRHQRRWQGGVVGARSALLMARPEDGGGVDVNGGGGGGGGRRPGQGHSFRNRGDLPSLVVGVGFLLARHRSSIRANEERKNVAIDNDGGGGGKSSVTSASSRRKAKVNRDEEEATVEVGGGIGKAAVSAVSAGLRAEPGKSHPVSSARRRSASVRRQRDGGGGGGSGGGSGGRMGHQDQQRQQQQQQQQRKRHRGRAATESSSVPALSGGGREATGSEEGGGDDGWQEMGHRWHEGESWREDEGVDVATEAEMGSLAEREDWLDVEDATQGGRRQEQQRARRPDDQVEQRQREQRPGQHRTKTAHTARSTSPAFSASSSRPSLEVSLDTSVMPAPVGPLVVWGAPLTAVLGAVAVTARVSRLLGVVLRLGSRRRKAMGEKTAPGSASSTTNISRKNLLPSPSAVVNDLRYGARLWGGSASSWVSRRSQQWERVFGPEEVLLPAKDWSVCSLLAKTREGGDSGGGSGGVYRYRFGLQSSPNAVLPLELGQELTLCGLDASDQVVHGDYVPLTPRKQRGFFEIVAQRDLGDPGDAFLSSKSEREFSRFLHSLPLGDEVAVRPGRDGLVYGGPDQPIRNLVLIAAGVGVVPMIQLVNELLPSSSTSSVASASVFWLNEKSEDFALYPELEKSFFRNHRKLDVSCIVERDLFGSHLEANARVQEAVPEFKLGTMTAVAGPEFFNNKVTDFLVRKGYPSETIIRL